MKAGFRPFDTLVVGDPDQIEYGNKIRSFLNKPAEAIKQEVINAIHTNTPISSISRISREEKLTAFSEFKATKQVADYIKINHQMQLWIASSTNIVHNYKDINSFELLENNSSISKGGVGRALAGGVLFGGVGAIVGGITAKRETNPVCQSLKLKIALNDINNPIIYLDFVKSQILKNSEEYKRIIRAAHECMSLLQIICNDVSSEEKNAVSTADEIARYKKLLDEDAITKEEYELKKKQLLGL